MSEARDILIKQLRNAERDLLAFKRAYDAVYGRYIELEDDPIYQKDFYDWPGFQATINVLMMTITRCEGLTEDYRRLLDELDTTAPVIELVRSKE